MSVPDVLPALILSAALMSAQDQGLRDTPAAPAEAPASKSGAAVSVDAYRRDYEGPKSDSELRYDSGIWSAYSAKENQLGAMEGSWVVTTADGRKLIGLELRSDSVVSGRLEGAWRSMLAGFGLNGSGFVSDVNLTGRDLEINYFAGRARSPTILQVHRDTDGQWRGKMLDTTGHKTAVVMSRAGNGD